MNNNNFKYVAILLLSCNVNAYANETDSQKIIDDLKYGAIVGTSMQSCNHFGFDIAKIDTEEFIDGFIEPAVKSGINYSTAKEIFMQNLRMENDNNNFLASRVTKTINQINSKKIEDYLANKEVNDFYDFWSSRCYSISQNEIGGKFVSNTKHLTVESAKENAVRELTANVNQDSQSKPSKKRKKQN